MRNFLKLPPIFLIDFLSDIFSMYFNFFIMLLSCNHTWCAVIIHNSNNIIMIILKIIVSRGHPIELQLYHNVMLEGGCSEFQ